MEVKGMGQGSQGNFDFTVKSIESNNTQTTAQPISQETSTSNEGENSSTKSNASMKEKKFDEKDVKKAVDKLNKLMEDTSTIAEFTVHEKFGDMMIKIVNKNTREVVAEVPPRKILDMVAKFCEMAGMVFDKKA